MNLELRTDSNQVPAMNPKISSILEKVGKERSRGNLPKALKRLTSAIEKYPGDLQLYKDAIELSLEAGEPLQSVQLLKKAVSRFNGESEMLWEFATTQVKQSSDPVLGKYLLEQFVKNRNLTEGYRIAQHIDERTAKDLLGRIHKKKETLSSVLRGSHRFSVELANNDLLGALLNLRIGKTFDAVHSFVHHMEKKPDECTEFEPLLHDLEKVHPKKGIIQYALGSCYLLSRQMDKGIRKIAQAAKLNPDLAEDIASRLERVKEKNPSPPENLEIALVETYLIRGDTEKASAQARSLLDDKPEKSQLVFDLILSHMDKVTTSWDLQQFYLDASLRSGQTQSLLHQIKKLCCDPDQKRDIFDWLDASFKAGTLPVEIQTFFGEKLLEERRTDWALNILRQTARTAPNDIPSIVHILEKHMASNPSVEALFFELGGQKKTEEETAEFDIQYFEKSEFSLSNYNDSNDGEDPPASEQEKEPGVKEEATQLELQADSPLGSSVSPPRGTPAYSRSERPQDSQVKSSPDSSCESLNGASLTHVVEEANRFKQDFPTVTPGESPVEKIKIPQETSAEADSRSMPEKQGTEHLPDPPDKPAVENLAATGTIDGKEPNDTLEDFDSIYRLFQTGALDNSMILDLIERAFELGKLKEVSELLSFQPEKDNEKIKRIFFLADYHIHHNHPLPALIALKSIDIKALPESDKREFLTKMASCYRELKMFAAAHSVFIQMMNDYPSDPIIEKLAKRNYQDYMKENCDDVQVLEKVSILR